MLNKNQELGYKIKDLEGEVSGLKFNNEDKDNKLREIQRKCENLEIQRNMLQDEYRKERDNVKVKVVEIKD